MNKIILVDGNNLLFRSYYATAYNGNFMKNSKGFPTNALFGFTNMMNKIINEENPQYIIVAFDKGKTFRHEKYEDYKGGRLETPEELKMQFPKAKEMLEAMGITYYEIDNYEADDIIGTFAKYCDDEPDFIGTIVSSDKDLLQLISHDVDIKLLKQKDYIRYNEETFKEAFGFEPTHIIDLKALMGDASDNIPGVKGVGEKTAMKLIQDYKTLDNLYEHIDEIKGKLQEKLINDKENAYKSMDLATIVCDVDMKIHIKDIKYNGPRLEDLNNIYDELEFYSFKKKIMNEIHEKDLEVKILDDLDNIKLKDNSAVYLEILGTNYHTSKILGLSIFNDEISGFIPFETLKKYPKFLSENKKCTYDLKKLYVALKWNNILVENLDFDSMIAGYLLDYNIKDDVAYLANNLGYDIQFYEAMYGKTKQTEPPLEQIAASAIMKAKFIYETRNKLKTELIEKELLNLFNDIEMPLSLTLGDMEYTGIHVDKNILDEMGEELKIKIELTEKEIYNHAGVEFNISSPKQLGEILFEKLELTHGKKNNRDGFSTAIDVLKKLKGTHPIIDKIIEYRGITKIYNTYVEGLKAFILNDNKVHTIYMQTLTRTGRLSSIEPNLQNIPARSEEGKLIRKAFLPTADNLIVSGDYSQIELRILAHMADVPSLEQAFINGMDVHTKTAMDIFKVDVVTPNMRRIAKAVNFGIIYGISSYGLSENLDISPKEAKEFIDKYFETYPGVKEYMDKTIEEAHKNIYVKTLFGRIRNIPELNNKNIMIQKQGERIALNTPIQGTSADIIKKAMIEIHNELIKRNLKTKMIMQVHDELVFDTPKDELEQIKELIHSMMENTYKLEVPLKVDVEYGANWYQAK